MHNFRLIPMAVLLAGLLIVSNASAGLITSQLTGDIRDANPNGLVIDVTIEYTGTHANWTIDINSTQHPDVKLDEFYFNLDLDAGELVSFSGFNPTGWYVNSPASVQGAGGTTFMFETLGQNGKDKPDNVTNDVNLEFTAIKSSDWTDEDFLNAMDAMSNDAGAGQLGAHLQSLEKLGPATTDSGFAFGDYNVGTPPGTPSVPEPSTMMLWSLLGFCGVTARRRNRENKQRV